MRTRLIVSAAVALALVGAVAVYLVTRAPERQSSNLPTRIVTVGAVEVRIEPVHLDAAGAAFRIKLDTHSTDLTMPLGGKLEVDGVVWSGGDWVGAAPGGHHREGEVGFRAGGPARGTARLEVTGLGRPVVGVWELADGT